MCLAGSSVPTGISESLFYEPDRVAGWSMAPDTEDRPSSIFKGFGISEIAFYVRLKLVLPIRGVRAGSGCVNRASMPKASVYEYR